MRTMILTACIMFAEVCLSIPCFAQDSGSGGGRKYGSPERFEKEIQRFEIADRQQSAATGAIVCIGSSSIRGWHDTIADDLAPLTIIPRGLGGSNMNDALHYADRIVLPYKPRAVVVYEGDNDIAQGIPPQTIAATFDEFVKKVHKRLPDCRMYFISIKPSIDRWSLWPKMKEANALIAARCANDKRLTFVDIAAGMLNGKEIPRGELFKKDNLHMTREGYMIWRDTLRPILMASELRYEREKPAGSDETNDGSTNKTPAPAPLKAAPSASSSD